MGWRRLADVIQGERRSEGKVRDDEFMNHDLLAHLLDQHAAALELYARQWCDTPEDIVQEAFLKLAGQRQVPDNPAAWLFRVVRNRAIDAGYAARRRRHHESVAAAGWSAWFEP